MKKRKAEFARRAVNAETRKLIRQELCRTLDPETYRLNTRYDVNNLCYKLSGGAGAAC